MDLMEHTTECDKLRNEELTTTIREIRQGLHLPKATKKLIRILIIK